jgi:hypothetical protein
MNEPEPPPIKYPPWVKKEILLPIFGVAAIGLMLGSFLVYRSIKKESRYSPLEYGPMDHHPFPNPVTTNGLVTNVPPVHTGTAN